MVSETDDGLLVGRSKIFYLQLVVVSECKLYSDLHFACESFLAIGRGVVQRQRTWAHLSCIPHAHIVTLVTSVQVVGAIVSSQLIFLAVEGEASFADTVAISSDKSGAIGLVGLNERLDVVETLDNVGHVAVLVGHHDGTDSSTVVGNGHFVSFTILQYV